MLKKMLLRGLIGFPVGITIGYAITIFLSLVWGDGSYSACVPSLAQQLGSEITAVILQAVLCGVLGFGFAAASVIWEMERWSLAKQTLVYFVISSLLMFPIAYINHWMERSFIGFVVYFTIFAVIFVFIWLTQYLILKNAINSINKQIRR